MHFEEIYMKRVAYFIFSFTTVVDFVLRLDEICFFFFRNTVALCE